MSLSGIHHVTLIVDDQERAAWFYGQVLELQPKHRPNFKFPGLFYHCGNQEVHLIVASRPLTKEDLFIQFDGIPDFTRRRTHRHAALVVPDLEVLESRLKDHDIEILFSEKSQEAQIPGTLENTSVQGWKQMYGGVPIFCEDPFGNLLEFVPGKNLTGFP